MSAIVPLTIEWSDDLIIGHADIDDEHKKIIEVVNIIAHAISVKNIDKCSQMLTAFIQLAKNHFAAEEKILLDNEYPDVKSHSEYHQILLVKAQNILNLCVGAEENDQLHAHFNELVEFLTHDILKGDLDFAPFLADKGLTKKS